MKQDCNQWWIFFRSVIVKWNKSRGTKWVGDTGFIHAHSREQINHKATVTDYIPTCFILAVYIRCLLMRYKKHTCAHFWLRHKHTPGWQSTGNVWDMNIHSMLPWTTEKTLRNFRHYLISSKTKIRMEQHTTRCVLSKTSRGKDADSKLVTARGFLLVWGKTLDVCLHPMVFRNALQYFSKLLPKPV